MQVITPNWINVPKNIGAFSTMRQGGVSAAPYDDGLGAGGLNLALHVGDQLHHVQQNRALLHSLLPSEPAWLTQVHGAVVVDAAAVAADAALNPPEADASIATQSGVVCVVQTADCLPVLFCDTTGKVVASVHAGWRGLAAGVLENTVMRMRDAGAGEIIAWLGPAIGAEKFEVGEEVRTAFMQHDPATQQAFKPLLQLLTDQPEKYLADIYMLARMRLQSVGVHRVHGGDWCTMSNERNFYSYRRDKATGRMATFIWMK